MSPGKRKAPEGTGADAITRHHQPEDYTSLEHECYMRQLGDRIRWLSTRRSDGRYPMHWWLRDFLEKRDGAA